MNLYYVRLDDYGDNYDALIEAESEAHALELWQKAYGFMTGDEPSWIGQVRLTGQARMIPWYSINPDSGD